MSAEIRDKGEWPEIQHYSPPFSNVRRYRLAAHQVDQFLGCASSTMVVCIFAPVAWLSRESVRRCLLAAIVLNISLPIGAHFGYREQAGAFGALGGLNITVTTIALAGLYLPWLLTLSHPTNADTARWWRSSEPLLFYLLFGLLSTFNARNVMLSLYELFMIFQLVLLHIWVVNSVQSWRDVLLIIRCLLFGLVAQGMLMIALAGGLAEADFISAEVTADNQNIGGITRQINVLGLKGRIDESEMGRSRVGGSEGSPNDAASYITGATTIAIGVLLSSLGRRYKVLATAALGIGVIALILTFSRGGWIAFVLGVGTMVLLGSQTEMRHWRPVVAVTLVLAALIGVFCRAAIVARLTEDDNGAATSRVPLMKLATFIVHDYPLLGAGANNFPLAMQDYLTRGFSGEFVYSVHNKYLLVLSETGPGGFIAFVCFMAAMLRRGLRVSRHKDAVISPFALGCTAAVAGEALHMFVDIFRGQPILQLLCVISALLVVLQRLAAATSARP